MDEIVNVLKVIAPTIVVFFIGISLTPLLTHFLYKHKMWKKRAGKVAPDGHTTPIFDSLHEKREVGTPRLGGIIIWSSTLLTIIIFALLAKFLPSPITSKLNFLSRNQTWLPLFTLIAASLIGLVDDLIEISVN